MGKNYKLSVFRRLAIHGELLFSKIEKKLIYNDMNLKKNKFPPVFIIGAPRTGSTILYQILTKTSNVLYIDNLSAFFYKNLLSGLYLSNLFFKDKSHSCFRSYHGNTFDCGLHAPSECGDFWYRWLPKEKHYVEPKDISQKNIIQMRRIIYSAIMRWKKPFLFKNLNAGQRLKLLKIVYPDAKFIFIRRNPLFTSQSIYLARNKEMKLKNEWWSIKPKNYKELMKLDTFEMIVGQIFYLEKQIINDRKLFSEKTFYDIDYKNICESPAETVNKLIKFIFNDDLRFNNNIDFSKILKYEEKRKISVKQFDILQRIVSTYNWESYEI